MYRCSRRLNVVSFFFASNSLSIVTLANGEIERAKLHSHTPILVHLCAIFCRRKRRCSWKSECVYVCGESMDRMAEWSTKQYEWIWTLFELQQFRFFSFIASCEWANALIFGLIDRYLVQMTSHVWNSIRKLQQIDETITYIVHCMQTGPTEAGESQRSWNSLLLLRLRAPRKLIPMSCLPSSERSGVFSSPKINQNDLWWARARAAVQWTREVDDNVMHTWFHIDKPHQEREAYHFWFWLR